MSIKKYTPDEEEISEENTLGQYIPLLYHFNMLQDEARVVSFQNAIRLVVKAGMHVVELGGGTGILSSFAGKCGARVTCVERNPELVATATNLIRGNELSDLVTVVQCDATQFIPDEPVDVVICEMLHVGFLREKQADVISEFKRNYAQKFPDSKLPVFIPEATFLLTQIIEQSFDFFGYVAPIPMFQSAGHIQPRTIELAKPALYANVNYHEKIPLRYRHRQTITAEQSGYLNAIRLLTQSVLAVDEPNQTAHTWANQFLVLPLPEPIQTTAGEEIDIAFDYESGDTVEKFQKSLAVERKTMQRSIAA